MRTAILCLAACTLACAVSGASAQGGPPDTAKLLAAQRSAMQSLARMDGVWRGEAKTTLRDGQVRIITQTERIGPMLDGTIKVIEGRGYDATGAVVFNAFGVVSYDVSKASFSMRSHAQGLSGDFVFKPTPDGYSWDIPAGPATIHYSATIRDGVLHEVGERVVPGAQPVRFFEMTLRRVGGTDWPAGGAVPPK
ncbi:MAG: DUF1579 domain-containing protein [Burkholderiaceae bacterium]|nr:MAG: DUF1579 domain-containing protein [Burkholderiaceae bacterium]MCC7286757.1 DUF1579 domain-containing protein [Burkholderiaceae bacterium]